MRGVHTFWTFKPGELFIILHTTTREEFYCVLKRLKSSMKRARRLAQLLGGGGLLDAKQLSGLNYYLGGKGERVRWRIPLSFCYLAGWRGLANRAGFQATPLPAL